MTSRLAIASFAATFASACVGPAGPVGEAGTTGSPGSTGSAGSSGTSGEPGQVGSAGAPGDTGSNGASGASQPDDDVLAGHWQYVSGPLIAGGYFDTIDALDLTADGHGTLFQHAPSGLRGCGPLAFAVLDDDVVELQIPDLVLTHLLRYELPDLDTLEFVDTDGTPTTFTRIATIPDAITCPQISVGPRVVLEPLPSGYSNLASDGTSLWYSPAGISALSIDPTTGTLGVAIVSPTQAFSYVAGMQGSDFWAHDEQGVSNELDLFDSSGSQLESVQIASPGAILDAASDPSDGSLWVALDGPAFVVEQLLDPATDPSSIGETLDLGAIATAMTFANGELWIAVRYTGSNLLEVDPATGTILQTFRLPDGGICQGLAELGGTLYALHARSGEGGVTDLLPLAVP